MSIDERDPRRMLPTGEADGPFDPDVPLGDPRQTSLQDYVDEIVTRRGLGPGEWVMGPDGSIGFVGANGRVVLVGKLPPTDVGSGTA